VVLSLAARRGGAAAVCCVDGGWTRPAWRFGTEAQFLAWAGPGATGGPVEDGPERGRRAAVLGSLFRGDPRGWYPLVGVPVTLCPMAPPDGRPDPDGRGALARTGVAEAVSGLRRARVSWYYGDGDTLAVDPAKLVDDLLALAERAEPDSSTGFVAHRMTPR
jgi:hypothetical protein